MKKTPKNLVGKFVFLRKINADDAEITLDWRNSRKAELLHAGAKSIQDQKFWINSRPTSEYNFIIESLTEGPCGMYSLISVDLKNRTGEQSRLLIPENHKGKPYVVEAMKLLLSFGFDQLNLVSITGKVLAENKRMILMHEFFGNRIKTEKKEETIIMGQVHPLVNIELSKKEYTEYTKLKIEEYLQRYRE